MRTMLLATLVAGGCLVGIQAPALAQGAAAAPQSLTPDAFSDQPPTPDWNAQRLYNEVQPRQLNVTRGHHRRTDVAPAER